MDSGLATETTIANDTSPSLEVERPTQTIALGSELRRISEITGKSHFGLIADFAKLAFGPGKLSFDEYLALRVWDKSFSRSDKRAFMGLAASRRIWLEANFQFEHFGLAENKIAATALFSAYGFPVIPTLALFCNQMGLPGSELLRTEDDVRHFLIRGRNYPLFGKPLEGLQSLGAASFERYDSGRDCLIGTRGAETPLDSFIRDIATHYGRGYLFQRRVSPHSDMRTLCGDCLATVRLITIMTKSGPRLLRACWKIPAGANIADNFWRSGNMLAQLDLSDGRVLRVIRGSGSAIEEVSHHPDTGAAMVGFAIPNWRSLVDLALEGTKVIPALALIGWDIASIDGGAVLVELNHNPDFKLPQLADGRGIMDDAMAEFIAERIRRGAAWRKAVHKAANEKEFVLQA